MFMINFGPIYEIQIEKLQIKLLFVQPCQKTSHNQNFGLHIFSLDISAIFLDPKVIIQPIYLYLKNSCLLNGKFISSINFFSSCFNYKKLMQMTITVLSKFSGSDSTKL